MNIERTNSLLIPVILNRVGGERHIRFGQGNTDVMSSRWQKRHSSPHTSIEMSVLITIHRQEYPCGSLGVQWRGDSTSFEQKCKNRRIEEYKSFALPGSALPQGSIVQSQEDPSAHDFPHQENCTLCRIVWYGNYITIKLLFKTLGFKLLKIIKNF